MERNGTKIEKKKDYLFSMYVNNLAYNKAKEFFLTLKNNEVQIGGCSSVRNGNWYGRNYDWMYDETAEFLVRTPRANGKNRTIGMCAGLTALTNSVVTEDITEGTWNELYSIVPFMILDGINGYGLIANMNVVPTDKGETEETVPLIEKRESICSLMLVRYILDNFKTATEAVNYIRDYVAIYMPDVLQEQHYETHIMIADNSKTYLLEFIDNENVVIDMSDSPYATNFYLDGVTLNQDGTVYTPATKDETHTPTETNGITERGSGLERWNYIVDNYDTCNTLQGMKSLMNGLRYTNTYDTTMDTFWWTEFVGVPYGEGQVLTVDSPVSDYETYAEPYIEKFSQRSRNPLSEGYGTWQTVHSVVYDMRNKKMYLIVQEDGEEIMSGLYEDMLIPVAPTQPQGDNSNKIATTEYVDSAVNNIQGHYVGEFVAMSCTADYVPEGCVPADGTEYSKSQFPTVWADYLTADTPLLPTCSYADYASEIASKGQCNKWAVDTVSETFKVPTIKDGSFLQQALSNGELGKCYAAGLPNIEGSIVGNEGTTGINNVFGGGHDGAYYLGDAVSTNEYIVRNAVASVQPKSFNFDASRSNPIYGNSTTVQPNAVTTRFFVCVASGSVNQSMLDWSAYMSALQSKANTDLSNVDNNIDYVVDSYTDNDGNWYRAYKSGWVEQGGIKSVSATTLNVPITLLKPYTDVNYNINVNIVNSMAFGGRNDDIGDYMGNAYGGATNRASTTGFYISVIYQNNTTGVGDVRWIACGQGETL